MQVSSVSRSRHGQVVAAALELVCSDAYICVQVERLGLTLLEVLDAGDTEAKQDK